MLKTLAWFECLRIFKGKISLKNKNKKMIYICVHTHLCMCGWVPVEARGVWHTCLPLLFPGARVTDSVSCQIGFWKTNSGL